jgi:hypothetical protein
MKSRLFIFAVWLAGAALLAGCKHVSPWERGALADPTMETGGDPLEKMYAEHLWFSREAAAGGEGVGGGGCGCN